MTCYFWHLDEVFKKAGVIVTRENKRELDMIIRGIVGVPHKNCSAVGREVKKKLAEDEAGFVLALKNAWETCLGQSV